MAFTRDYTDANTGLTVAGAFYFVTGFTFSRAGVAGGAPVQVNVAVYTSQAAKAAGKAPLYEYAKPMPLAVAAQVFVINGAGAANTAFKALLVRIYTWAKLDPDFSGAVDVNDPAE